MSLIPNGSPSGLQTTGTANMELNCPQNKHCPHIVQKTDAHFLGVEWCYESTCDRPELDCSIKKHSKNVLVKEGAVVAPIIIAQESGIKATVLDRYLQARQRNAAPIRDIIEVA